MKQKGRKIIFLCMLLLSVTVMPDTAQAREREQKRVLFISSYSYAWDTVQMQIEGIKQGVDKDVVLDYEFMDTKRVDDETSRALFYEGLSYRLSRVEPYDAVILGDDAALQFALEYREELFCGIPLVFEGVNDEELAREAVKDPLIAGVIEKLSFEKNIEMALKILPDAERVVGILDDTITGEAERKKFYQQAQLYPDLEFSEINTSRLTTAALKQELNGIRNNTILIYVVMTEDASGRKYTNQESVQMIKKLCSVPAFRMVEGGIGEGLFGGNVVSMEQSGQIAAQMAMDIINGEKTAAQWGIVAESPNIYCVDEQVVKKFGIDKALLPEDTVYVNHELTFWERNREAATLGAVLLAALIAVLVCVGIDNIKKRKLAKALKTVSSYLEHASQHDFLTGLSNRSKFREDLQGIIEEKIPCTVIMLDIDNFKVINDSYGHIVGDQALKQVADRLKSMQTQLLTPYRFAGDEFILILKSDNVQIVERTAFQCRQVFQKPFDINGTSKNIYGSIGIASYPRDTMELEQLIVCADAAMYEVKKTGKNAYGYYRNRKETEGGI